MTHQIRSISTEELDIEREAFKQQCYVEYKDTRGYVTRITVPDWKRVAWVETRKDIIVEIDPNHFSIEPYLLELRNGLDRLIEGERRKHGAHSQPLDGI